MINSYVLGGSGRLWAPLHAALRVFDVLAWMEGREAGVTDDDQASDRR